MAEKEKKPPYLRWHLALPDNVSFRGENLDSLNRATLNHIHGLALQDDAMRKFPVPHWLIESIWFKWLYNITRG